MTTFWLLFESTCTPLNNADHAAMFVWLIDSVPRDAASLMATVKTLNNRQSFVGCVSYVLAQRYQSLVRATADFMYNVCHGVPRCTCPSQPMFANEPFGNCQSSERRIPGSFRLRS